MRVAASFAQARCFGLQGAKKFAGAWVDRGPFDWCQRFPTFMIRISVAPSAPCDPPVRPWSFSPRPRVRMSRDTEALQFDKRASCELVLHHLAGGLTGGETLTMASWPSKLGLCAKASVVCPTDQHSYLHVQTFRHDVPPLCSLLNRAMCVLQRLAM